MTKLEEIEKKFQQLKEKYQKGKETASNLKKENAALERELKNKNILFGNTPAGIVLIWRGRILEVNDTFLGYMGYKSEEMINRNFLNFIHPDNLSEVRFIHNRWNTGKVSRGHYDTKLVTESDESILCSIDARRIRYRGRASYLLNITRLEGREEIQKEEKNKVRGNTEHRMLEGFDSLLRKRSEAIIDLLSLFRASGKPESKFIDEAREKLKAEQEVILKDVGMLETIISEKEDYRHKKVTGINRLITEAVGRVSKTEEAGEIDINTYLRASSSISGDIGELIEAMAQLLLNSISNVSGAGEIHVTTEENAEKIYVYIQDSGLSVRENKIENIFEPFNENNPSPVHELGMRFAMAVIRRHNGEIEYLPGRGQGNIFQVILPVFKEPSVRKKIDRNKMKKARILIIQPDDIAKELFAHLFLEKGCRVDKAGNTVEGLTAIRKKKINLLVADIEGLSMNGRVFWKKCRQINPGLITVGLKNGSNIKGSKDSEEAGPDLIISKPFDIKNAVNRISELFMVKY